MTLAQHRREIRRLQQRAARATTRLNKFKLKLTLEGGDLEEKELYWAQARARLFAVWELQDALSDRKVRRPQPQIKKLVARTTRA